MTTWSFFRSDTGVLIGTTYSGPVDALVENTPAGTVAVIGRHDPLCRCVDLATGSIVPYRPPAPADDVLQTWAWDGASERWVSRPTLAAAARDVRAKRKSLLNDSDWVVTQALEDGTPVPVLWRKYRKALRDITLQAGFPSTVDWPIPPV